MLNSLGDFLDKLSRLGTRAAGRQVVDQRGVRQPGQAAPRDPLHHLGMPLGGRRDQRARPQIEVDDDAELQLALEMSMEDQHLDRPAAAPVKGDPLENMLVAAAIMELDSRLVDEISKNYEIFLKEIRTAFPEQLNAMTPEKFSQLWVTEVDKRQQELKRRIEKDLTDPSATPINKIHAFVNMFMDLVQHHPLLNLADETNGHIPALVPPHAGLPLAQEEDWELELAKKLSSEEAEKKPAHNGAPAPASSHINEEEEAFQRAIKASLAHSEQEKKAEQQEEKEKPAPAAISSPPSASGSPSHNSPPPAGVSVPVVDEAEEEAVKKLEGDISRLIRYGLNVMEGAGAIKQKLEDKTKDVASGKRSDVLKQQKETLEAYIKSSKKYSPEEFDEFLNKGEQRKKALLAAYNRQQQEAKEKKEEQTDAKRRKVEPSNGALGAKI